MSKSAVYQVASRLPGRQKLAKKVKILFGADVNAEGRRSGCDCLAYVGGRFHRANSLAPPLVHDTALPLRTGLI